MEKREVADFDELTAFDFKNAIKEQGGIGFHTLCKSCNNNTGSWYGNDYIKWVQQSTAKLREGSTHLPFPISMYPLRIIKQVVAMFFSLNHAEFRSDYPSLAKYLLHKNSTSLDPAIRIFAYYNVIGQRRYLAHNILGLIDRNKTYHLSEITFPPIGLVMSINSENPDERLTEITHFTKYKYDEQIEYLQNFNMLPTHLPVICDFRNETEIREALKEAKNIFREK